MKRLLHILPLFFVLFACNQQKTHSTRNETEQNDSAESVIQSSLDNIIVKDSIVESVELSDDENNVEEDSNNSGWQFDGIEMDTTDECYQMSFKDIENYKKVLSDKIISSDKRTIYYKTKEGLIASIYREGGCQGCEWQNLDLKIRGFENQDWRSFDTLRNLFKNQVEILPGEYIQRAFEMLSEDEFLPNTGNSMIWNCKNSKMDAYTLDISYYYDSVAVLEFGYYTP